MRMVKGYILSLLDPEFIATGLKTAIFVGTLLFIINHGLALLRGEMTFDRWLSVIATYAMPYLVNVYGQYSYRRRLSGQNAVSSESNKVRSAP